jgi:hypothetical protein
MSRFNAEGKDEGPIYDRLFALIGRVAPELRNFRGGDYAQASWPAHPDTDELHLDVIRHRGQPASRMVAILSRNAHFNGNSLPDPEFTFVVDFNEEIARPIAVQRGSTNSSAIKRDGTLDHASLLLLSMQSESWLKEIDAKGYRFTKIEYGPEFVEPSGDGFSQGMTA